METRHEIKCVNKTDRYDPHERIKAADGENPDGSASKISQ